MSPPSTDSAAGRDITGVDAPRGRERSASDGSASPRIVLVDDLRSFLDGRRAQVARTSQAGVALLEQLAGGRIDELWLDHDLGGEDTIWPVVEVLERGAFEGRPLDVGVVHVHSANPPGAAKVVQALTRWGYDVRLVTGSAQVGCREG